RQERHLVGRGRGLGEEPHDQRRGRPGDVLREPVDVALLLRRAIDGDSLGEHFGARTLPQARYARRVPRFERREVEEPAAPSLIPPWFEPDEEQASPPWPIPFESTGAP